MQAAWRLFNVWVDVKADPGKDSVEVSPALASKCSRILLCRDDAPIPMRAITIVRKSYDPRGDTRSAESDGHTSFAYTVLVDHQAALKCGATLKHRNGKQERVFKDEMAAIQAANAATLAAPPGGRTPSPNASDDPVIVVGAGPAGLFAALALAEAGQKVTLLERGKSVEDRGADIGALVVRKLLDPESNFCYGEGGAGTWSDGKLTTKIGKNSDAVRTVLNTLHHFGAPATVLVTGKPHVGTDNLVKILKRFRAHLIALGCDIRFSAKVARLTTSDGHVTGIVTEAGETISASKVVLAPGHSAREMYEHLLESGVELAAKPFAMGFRIEHPQSAVNEVQYGTYGAALVEKGKGKVPVADYKLATKVDVNFAMDHEDLELELNRHAWVVDNKGAKLPTLSSAADFRTRGVYSFCMCPGGQIVPTSTSPDELCINGMSFSKRDSEWANSALVVGIQPQDWEVFEEEYGVLAGVQLQRVIERRAALLGGGDFVAPVQRAEDFLHGDISTDLPSSSYRLGVKSAPLHELYPFAITDALRSALRRFDRTMEGFLHRDALLHGAETRTSAPVTIVRDTACESVSLKGLYPCGEGAGYAGGIMSAAVDGMRVAAAVLGTTDAAQDAKSDREVEAQPNRKSFMY